MKATLLAIRAVRETVRIGMRESEVRQLMSDALGAAGLKDGGCLTLFGGMSLCLSLTSLLTIVHHHLENAALPHGSGTDRVLGAHDFVLVDCDAGLHGYRSDITRVRSTVTALNRAHPWTRRMPYPNLPSMPPT